MKQKHKKVLKIFKVGWVLAGIIITIGTLFFFMRNQMSRDLELTTRTLFFAAGLYILLIYLITTMIFILVQEIIKRMKEI